MGRIGRGAIAGFCALLLAGCAATPAVRPTAASPADLREQVAAAERGFAQTMAKRDFAAFQTYLADDTVFFDGRQPLRGKAAVVASWKRFYEAPAAPFSWEPRDVEVLDDGTLALTAGPVRTPDGKVVATFQTVWRLENGGWRIVFDKGSKACE